jgi:spore maturation protein CgeB
VASIVAGRDSGFWYFDAALPLSPRVVTLARLTTRVFATYGYQVEAFREAGIQAAFFLPQGADPEYDRPAERFPESYRCDVSFVGSAPYPRRQQTLRAIAAMCRLQIRGPGWDHAAVGLPIAGGRVKGQAFAQVVRGAAISLGIDALPEQRREAQGGTSNRLWRVLGAGGLFLGEWVGGIEAFARNGEHAVWYRDAEDARERITQLLADPDGRRRVAEAGRAHVLAQHTYRHRLSLLLAGRGYSST